MTFINRTMLFRSFSSSFILMYLMLSCMRGNHNIFNAFTRRRVFSISCANSCEVFFHLRQLQHILKNRGERLHCAINFAGCHGKAIGIKTLSPLHSFVRKVYIGTGTDMMLRVVISNSTLLGVKAALVPTPPGTSERMPR